MKKFQKLFGLCLIGSLLVEHPISGADFGVDISGMLNLLSFSSENGEEGNDQSPIMMIDGENILDEEIKERMKLLCFDRLFDATPPGHVGRFRLTFNDCNLKKSSELKKFFENFAPNNKERLQSCGYQLLMQEGFDLESWSSKDHNCKMNESNNFVVALMMLEKIIDGFDAKVHFSMPDDTGLWCTTQYPIWFAKEGHYKEEFGDSCNVINIKPAK